MKRLKILLVDDDPEFAQGLALSLEVVGHSVISATNGAEALKIIETEAFDIAFVDVRMPGIDGLQVLGRTLHARPESKIVLMTAFREPDLQVRALDIGALDVLDKPISNEDLTRSIKLANLVGNVFVADDDPDFVEGIVDTLRSEGYSVVIANNGESAIERLTSENFDVLLLDLRLPGVSGLDVYRTLEDRNRVPPTIVISGYAEEEAQAIDELSRKAVTACLNKPVEAQELLQALENSMAG